MYIDLYERIWMWAGAAIIVMYLGVMIVPGSVRPPAQSPE